MTDKSEKDTSKLHEQPADADEIRDVMDDSTADTETADITESEAEGLMQQVQQLTEALEKEKKDYLFLRADFDNYRKRMLKEREELLRNAAEKVLKGLLPIVDDFERGPRPPRTPTAPTLCAKAWSSSTTNSSNTSPTTA